MWRGLFLFVCLTGCFAVLAQEKESREVKWTQAGASLLKQQNFQGALVFYSRLDSIYPGNPDNAFAQGICIFNAFDKPSSLTFFLKAKQLGCTEVLLNYYLGRAYYFNNEMDLALHYLGEYKRALDQTPEENAVKSKELQQLFKQIVSSKEVLEKKLSLDVINMGPIINSPEADYVPVVIGNGDQLVFTSRRHKSTGGKRAKDGAHYEDIYTSHKDSSGNWTTPIHFHGFNSIKHDANVALSHDGNTLFIYKAAHNGDLFYSSKKNEKWSSLKPVKGINTPYWEASACLSFDETTLFISSDRPGGYGGSDLYRAERLPDGTWGNVTNLGPTINTEQDEDAPYIYKDGKTLFFSSKGHNAIGGYDIFSSRLASDGQWEPVKNMGFPISTFDDDIYFHLNMDGSIGYFTSFRHSNFREKSIGEKDLFQISRPEASPMKFVLKGKITNRETDEPVTAIVTVKDLAHHQENQLTDIATGTFKFNLQFDNRYKLTVEIAGKIYKSSELFFPYQADLFEYFLPLPLDSVPTFDLKLADLVLEEKNKSESIVLNKNERAIMLVHKIAPNDTDIKKLLESDKIPFSFRNKLAAQLSEKKPLDETIEEDRKEDFLNYLRDTTFTSAPEKMELPVAQQTRLIDAASAKSNYDYAILKKDTVSARKDKIVYNRLSSGEQSLIDRLANQIIHPDSLYQIATADLLYYENLTGEEKRNFKRIVIHRTKELVPCSGQEELIRFQDLNRILDSVTVKALAKSKLAFYDHEAWEVLYSIETSGFEKDALLQFEALLMKRNNGSAVSGRKLIVVDDEGHLFMQLESGSNGKFALPNIRAGKRYHILIDDYAVALTGFSRFALRDISLTAQEEDYMAFYRKLSAEEKRKVDRMAAALFLQQLDQENSTLLWEDAAFAEGRTADEMELVTQLQLYLQADSQKDEHFVLDPKQSERYDLTDPLTREKYDRFIARNTFDKQGTNIVLRAGDSLFYKNLTDQEKKYVKAISLHRKKSRHIMGDWMDDQSKDEYWYDMGQVDTHWKTPKVKVTGRIKRKTNSVSNTIFTVGLMDESGQIIAVVDSDSTGHFGFENTDSNQKFKILLKKPEEGSVLDYDLSELKIEADDTIYDMLSPTERRRIDRIIARNMMDQSYTQDPSLLLADKEKFASLAPEEKAFIQRLQYHLFADTVTEKNVFLKKEDHKIYYSGLQENKREFINRYIVASFRDTLHSSGVLLEDKDNFVYSRLSSSQKQQIALMQKKRVVGKDLFNENPLLFVASRRILLDSITPGLKNIIYSIKGQLINDAGEGLPHTPLYLSDREGTMLAMVSTDAFGHFEFENRTEKEELFALVEDVRTSFFGSEHYEIKDFRIIDPDSNQALPPTHQQTEQLALEIYFDFDSDELRPEEKEHLNRWIVQNKEQLSSVIPFSVAGHTDQRGSSTYNQKLSERRAETVVAFMKKQTNKSNEWHIQGFGKSLPKYSSDSLNRRVELHVLESHVSTKKSNR